MEPAVEDAVMLRLIDAVGLHVFLAVEVQPFAPGQVAVVHGAITVFLSLNVLLAALQTVGLPGAEPAGDDAIVDASLFVVETTIHFIDAWMEGVEEIKGASAVRESGGAQQGDQGQCAKRFHGV